MVNASENQLVHGALTFRAVIVAFHVILGSHVSKVLNPGLFVLLRVIITVPFMWGIRQYLARGKPEAIQSLSWLVHGKIAFLGLLGITLNQVLAFEGTSLTGANTLALLMPISPLVVSGVEILLKREKFHWLKGVGLAVAVAGTIVTVDPTSSNVNVGALLIVANLLAFASFLLLQKPLLAQHPEVSPPTLIHYAILWSIPQIALYGGWYVDQIPDIELSTWGAILYTSVGGTAISYVITVWTVSVAGASVPAAYSFLAPVVVVVLQSVFFNDPLSTNELIGGLLNISGLGCLIYVKFHPELISGDFSGPVELSDVAECADMTPMGSEAVDEEPHIVDISSVVPSCSGLEYAISSSPKITATSAAPPVKLKLETSA